MNKEQTLDYLSSVDYINFSTTLLYEAGKLHASVNQFYDASLGLPYQYHLNLVLEYAKSGFPDMDLTPGVIRVITFACVFHDALEDTRETYHNIIDRARDHLDNEFEITSAADIVYAVTNEKGKNRAERANSTYYAGILQTPYASYVKVCDRLANAYCLVGNTRMREVYRKENDEFIKKVTISSGIPKILLEKLREI